MEQELLTVARAAQRVWADAFAARDWPRLIALYAPDVAFWGSTAPLYTGIDGVRDYFLTLPASFKRACYATPHILRLGPDSFAASGEVIFARETDGKALDLPFRMTHVFVRHGDAWKIAVHHASPRPATG